MAKTNVKVNIKETISYNIKNINLNQDVFFVDNGQQDNMVVFVEDLKLLSFNLVRNTPNSAFIKLTLIADLYNSVRDLKTNRGKTLSSAKINIDLFIEPMAFHDIKGLFALNLSEATITVTNGKLVDTDNEDITNEIIKQLNNRAVEFNIEQESDVTEFDFV